MRANARARAPASPAVEILVQSRHWAALPQAKSLIRRAVVAAADVLSTSGGELAIVLTDDSAIRELNRQWRGIDAPTNVLSFPASSNLLPPPAGREIAPGATSSCKGAGPRAQPLLLGDIVIAYETTAREASAEGKPLPHHLAHLAVHGFLHLLGYDHQSEREARVMEGLETAILARLAMPDPYRART